MFSEVYERIVVPSVLYGADMGSKEEIECDGNEMVKEYVWYNQDR